MARSIDLTGKRFGRLVLVKLAYKNKRGNPMWLCKCDCGKETIVNYHNLKNVHTTSCGCFRKERTIETNTRHGLRETRLFRIWVHMKDRCYRYTDKRYPIYGGRGITICDVWKKDFKAFYDWSMANGYSDDLTIDRIDVNGNYEPSNCRWVTMDEQAKNRRTSHFITIDGETLILADWTKKMNISKKTYYDRIKKGWSDEQAILTPARGVVK